MRSSRAFSTLRILPRRGRIAWVARERAVLAEPPAESPSTMKISQFFGSLSVQSASFPGRDRPSRAFFLRVISRAFLAASRARWASRDFSTVALPTFGFCSRKIVRHSDSTELTAPLASELPSFCLVCPSNWGSSIFTEMIEVRPSRISSPKPSTCMPPSGVTMLLTKP